MAFMFLFITLVTLVTVYYAEDIRNLNMTKPDLCMLAVQAALSVLMLIWMRLTSCYKPGDFRLKGLGRGLLFGWLGLLYAAVLLAIALLSVPVEYLVVPKLLPIIIALLKTVLVGVFEEFMMRGMALNLLLKSKGGNKKTLGAVLLSSLFFGAAHLANIQSAEDILPVIFQVIYASMIGVYFAAVYLRTKSLLVPIILHGLFDFSGFLLQAIVSPEGLQALIQQPTGVESLADSFLSVVLTLPFLFVGIWMLRKYDDPTVVPTVALTQHSEEPTGSLHSTD
jgi:membrane protease YdiL (CAAX protease family)